MKFANQIKLELNSMCPIIYNIWFRSIDCQHIIATNKLKTNLCKSNISNGKYGHDIYFLLIDISYISIIYQNTVKTFYVCQFALFPIWKNQFDFVSLHICQILFENFKLWQFWQFFFKFLKAVTVRTHQNIL